MDNISSKILLLPKEIQDIIHEFNVEHRPMMNPVFQVIRSLHLKCVVCDAYLNDNPSEDIIYIMKNVFACSKKCEITACEEFKNVP